MAILDDERGWRRNLLDIFYDSDNMAGRSLDLFDDFPITFMRTVLPITSLISRGFSLFLTLW